VGHILESGENVAKGPLKKALPLVALAFGLLMVTACSDERPPGQASTPTPETRNTATAQTALGTAQVVRVLDGMTIEVAVDGQAFVVRYLGVDIPAAAAQEALAFNAFLVDGRTVELQRDVADVDSQGRLLRYVYVSGEMVNQALLTNGYAVVSSSAEGFIHQAEFLVAQESAKKTERGVWEPSRQAQAGHEEASPTATSDQSGNVQEFSGGTLPRPRDGAAAACDYSGTKEAVIKGNVDLVTGERTYHVPGGFFYDTIVVDERGGDAWLCTELEAIAQGWKRSKR